MYKELDAVKLSHLYNTEGWDSLIINRRKPYTYRAFKILENGVRVCVHRFEPCSSNEAFLHPHPWPSAMLVLSGTYRMKVGCSPDRTSEPRMIVDTVLSAKSRYSMVDPLSWHSVQPIETCWSIMVNGTPWGPEVAHIKAPTTKGKDLDKMSKTDLEQHLNTAAFHFQQILANMTEAYHKWEPDI